MKYFNLLIILVLLSLQLQAQDIIDPKPLFDKDTLALFDNRPYQFIKGWNWAGPGRILDYALNFNCYHTGQYIYTGSNTDLSAYDIKDSLKLMLNVSLPSNCDKTLLGRGDTLALCTEALYLEPSIIVDTSENFKPRWNDNCGAVFGFKYHNWTVGDTVSSGYDQYRFILHESRLSGESAIVLDSIWNGTILKHLDYKGTNIDSTIVPTALHKINGDSDIVYFHPYNGKQWYVTVNLRAMDPDDLMEHLNDTILSIELPYSLYNLDSNKHYSGLIRFDALPNINYEGDTVTIKDTYRHERRGVYKQIYEVPSMPTKFYITGRMLLSNNGIPDNSITLSAFFKNDGEKEEPNFTYRNNPRFKHDYYANLLNSHDYIDTINLRVTYFGHTDVAIDFIRLETPNTRRAFFGDRDSLIRACLDTAFARLNKNLRLPRIYRIYAEDEMLPAQWAMNRYFNILVDTIASSENFYHENRPNRQFNYSIGFKELWNGSNVNFHNDNAAPYIKMGDTAFSPEYFGYLFGYKGNNAPIIFTDTLNSQYETRLSGYYQAIPINDQNVFEYTSSSPICNWPDGTLFKIETEIYRNYYKNHAMLYHNKRWIANLWVQSEAWYVDTETNSLTLGSYCERPKTGEELRLMLNYPIILGAKGMLYWCKTSSTNVPSAEDKLSLGLQNNDYDYQGLTGEDLVYSDIIGGDFVQMDGDPNEMDEQIDEDVYNFDDLGFTSDRIYIGLKSARAEIYKKHKWIDAVEPELLRLKLACWYAKGFLTWYRQDTETFGTDTILKKFISLDHSRFRTRPIGRDTALTPAKPWQRLPYYEPWDSSFFDITILRDSSDYTLNSGSITIGVQNRRTDALVRTFDTTYTPSFKIDSSMKFYTTAEFDERIQNGGNRLNGQFDSAFYWKNLIWKKLGNREITIPFNYKYSSDTNQYALLHIYEYGFDNEELNTHPWRDTSVYHRVDTIIGQDRALVLRMHAGEGKLLKVEVIPPVERKEGSLEYANQRKLVGSPLRITNSVLYNDTMYYHLVYHKFDDVSNRYKVYYRRSLPVAHNSNYWDNSNIVWSYERCLSDSVLCIDHVSHFNTPTDCKYPTIVVRYDSVLNKSRAYIVFTCNGRQPGDEPPDCDNDYVSIVENVINADDPVQAVYISKTIGRACGSDYDKWGVSSVNASRYGNYYVWTDSIKGIQTAWKRPYDTYFDQSFDYDGSQFNWYGNFICESQHPSLNSYSKISLNENDCALVWQERTSNDTTNPFKIHYTLLSINNNGTRVNHHLTKNIRVLNPALLYNTDTTIVTVSNTNQIGRLPSVFRNTEDYGNLQEIFDVISWQSNLRDSLEWCKYNYSYLGKNFVNSRTLRHNGLYQGVAGNTEIRPISRVFCNSNSLNVPNMSQGCGITPGSLYGNPNAVILEFTQENYCYEDNDLNPKIWQYPHDYLSFNNLPYNNIYTNNYSTIHTNAKQVHSQGRLAQLAARPSMHSNLEWWQNRRVYQYYSSPSDTEIVTTSKEFYRGDEDITVAVPFIGFGDTLNNSLISPILLDLYRIDFDIDHLYPEIKDTTKRRINQYKTKDTIRTNWFKVADASDLFFISNGMNNNNVDLKIERKRDRGVSNLSLRNVNSNKTDNFNYRLVNGENNEFRLLFIKKNRSYELIENLVLMADPFVDNSYQKGVSDGIIVDLGSLSENTNFSNDIVLSIYPNPSDDKVYATATLPAKSLNKNNKITISLYSALGVEFSKFKVNSGETIEISTISLPQGIYFLKAESESSEFEIKSLIIQR